MRSISREAKGRYPRRCSSPHSRWVCCWGGDCDLSGLAVGCKLLRGILPYRLLDAFALPAACQSSHLHPHEYRRHGAGRCECGPMLAEEVNQRRHLGYKFLGFATYRDPERMSPGRPAGPDAFHRMTSLDELARDYDVKVLVVLGKNSRPPALRELVECWLSGIEVPDFESFYERLTGKVLLPFLRESWMLLVERLRTLAVAAGRQANDRSRGRAGSRRAYAAGRGGDRGRHQAGICRSDPVLARSSSARSKSTALPMSTTWSSTGVRSASARKSLRRNSGMNSGTLRFRSRRRYPGSAGAS